MTAIARLIDSTIAVSLCLLVAACDTRSPEAPLDKDPADVVATSSTGEMFHLDSAELKAAKLLATNGDTEAAMRVADHFSLSELDTKASIPWRTLAADSGNITAMQNLAYDLYTLGGAENCRMSMEWFKRIKSEQPKEVVKALQIDDSIRDLSANYAKCVKQGRF